MTMLKLGEGLRIPLDALTNTFGLVGKRGVGKTSCAVVMAEEMIGHGGQVVIVDPVGVWWGLRSMANGTSTGIPILIMGGEHGDLPIDARAGAQVARFVVEKRASVLLDLGALSKTGQRQFVADFLEHVYQLKNRDAWRTPMHLILDEADAFAPQRLGKGEFVERCYGAVDTAVRRGRARGIGVTLVTQRSAAINKDVLSQVETLIAFRTIGPQDRAAIEAWIEVHGDEEKRKEVLSTLHTLTVGEAWVWSPSWLEMLRRVTFRQRITFDSSATPKVGARVAAPKAIAKVDVEQLGAELAALVEKGKQEDPRRLQARVAELERELAAAVKEHVPLVETRIVEKPVLREADRHALGSMMNRIEALRGGMGLLLKAIEDRIGAPATPGPFAQIGQAGRKAMYAESPLVHRLAERQTPPPREQKVYRDDPETKARRKRAVGELENGGGYRAGERRLLEVTAMRFPQRLTVQQMATLAGMSAGGGTFGAYFSRLKRDGMLEQQDQLVYITEKGRQYIGTPPPLERAALQEMWLARFNRAGQRRMLGELLAVFPEGMTRQKLGEIAEVAPEGGTFSAYLSELKRNGVVEERDGQLFAGDALFL